MRLTPPPPPPPPSSHSVSIDWGQLGHEGPTNRVDHEAPKTKVSSLDFERIINQYSIQAVRDRLPVDASSEADGVEEDGQNFFINSERRSLLKNEGGMKKCYSEGDLTGILPVDDFEGPFFGRFQQRGSYKGDQLSQTSSQYLPKKRSASGYGGRPFTRWLLTLSTALLMGLTAIIIVKCTEALVEWRSEQLDRLWAVEYFGVRWIALFYTVFNLILAVISALLCLWFAPEAVGSGIPEVKAYLNGVRAPNLVGLPLFVVKIVATVLSVSSGLACGPEGPFIHLGSMIGMSCARLMKQIRHVHFLLAPKWRTRLLSWIDVDLMHFGCDAERRDLVSIGAAAGFAAAFGAPVGGLLFSLEEASSFFSHSMFLRTLVATALGTFCLAIHHGDLTEYSVINLRNFHSPNTDIFLSRFEELPLYMLVGAAFGFLGGGFVYCWREIQLFKQRFFKTNRSYHFSYQLLEIVGLSLLTSGLTFYLSMQKFSCKGIGITDDIVEVDAAAWQSHVHEVGCMPGQINEIAAIFFGGRDEPIRAILKEPGQFEPNTLLLVGLTFLPLMTLTLGVSLPSGIFMPSILIGCCLGGYMGLVFQKLFSADLSPSTFALLGAAALLTGIQRSTVSLCVILVEGTGQVKVLIPVIVTVVVARYVADRITHDGLYEVSIELKSYPYLGHEEKNRYDIFEVGHIMSAPPVCVGSRERAHTIAKLLEESNHNGFPVVDKSVDGGRFLGLVRRDQLVALLECGVFLKDDDLRQFAELEEFNIGTPLSRQWTPTPGISDSPLMNLAYHIKDDRYHHVTEVGSDELDEEDDQKAWINSVQKRFQNLDGESLPSAVTEALQVGVKGAPGCKKTR